MANEPQETRWKGATWLAAPLFLWMLLLLVVPLFILTVYAFLQRGAYGEVLFVPSLINFVRLLDPLYVQIYAKSLWLALSAAVVCLLIGYPMAYGLVRAPQLLSRFLLTALMLPFLSNFVVRAYAIKVLLGTEGPINSLLKAYFGTSLVLTDTPLAVWFGMITNYLPFMVWPLYGVLLRFDFHLVEAAFDLGANAWGAFWRVLIPGTWIGIVSGSMLVFIPCLGEFMIPDMLGGAKSMFLGNLIADQFLKARDWPFGAALVLLLVASLMMGLLIQKRHSLTRGVQ